MTSPISWQKRARTNCTNCEPPARSGSLRLALAPLSRGHRLEKNLALRRACRLGDDQIKIANPTRAQESFAPQASMLNGNDRAVIVRDNTKTELFDLVPRIPYQQRKACRGHRRIQNRGLLYVRKGLVDGKEFLAEIISYG